MSEKHSTENALVEHLDPDAAHADEHVQLLLHELTPLDRLKGSVIRYERPTEPVWCEWFDSDSRATEGFMNDRDQPAKDDG